MNSKTALALIALVLFGCGKPEEPKKEDRTAGGPTKTTAPDRKGAIVDEVIFVQSSETDRAKAVEEIEAGTAHVYALGINDPALFKKIRESKKIAYDSSYGSFVALTCNPKGPVFGGTKKLNPFAVPAIREALNRLVDRKYIIEEIYEGLAVPRWLAMNTAFPDYARLADVARNLELQYSHDPEAAAKAIDAEMAKLGAKKVDGKWQYDGAPVEINFIIRVEDKRRQIGDYVANLLNGIGFTVKPLYRPAREAAALWLVGNPDAGEWHLYTAGWISTLLSRDQAGNFGDFYTPRGSSSPLYQAYTPAPAFEAVVDKLYRRDYKTWEERQALMAEAMKLSLKESNHVFLADQLSVWPHAPNVSLAVDLAGGVSGSYLWPYTIRFTDKPGGRIYFGSPSLLTEPWNPVVNSSWIYDTMVARGTGMRNLLPDPFTGLYWPQRVESAEVTVRKGSPVMKTHDWITLKEQEEIQVPKDAWIDWNVPEQRFFTVEEKHPDGLKARTKTVIRFDKNLFKNKWHDGSNLSAADYAFEMALTFARARKGGPLFDESAVPAFESFFHDFRGWKIASKDPLVLEVYSDQIYPDAEWIVEGRCLHLMEGWGPWHTVALGIRAETQGKLAFSLGKSDKLNVERANYVAGESLGVLTTMLEEATKEGYIPFPNVMKEFIGEKETATRYAALKTFSEKQKHFWVGNGPFFVSAVHTTEKNIVLHRFKEFPDAADKWLRFAKPRLPDVVVSGPPAAKMGTAASFEISITFEGKPYPADEIDMVSWMVFNGRGELAVKGKAPEAGKGLWKVELSGDQLKGIGAGSSRLEVVVTSRSVAKPVFETYTFAVLGE